MFSRAWKTSVKRAMKVKDLMKQLVSIHRETRQSKGMLSPSNRELLIEAHIVHPSRAPHVKSRPLLPTSRKSAQTRGPLLLSAPKIRLLVIKWNPKPWSLIRMLSRYKKIRPRRHLGGLNKMQIVPSHQRWLSSLRTRIWTSARSLVHPLVINKVVSLASLARPAQASGRKVDPPRPCPNLKHLTLQKKEAHSNHSTNPSQNHFSTPPATKWVVITMARFVLYHKATLKRAVDSKGPRVRTGLTQIDPDSYREAGATRWYLKPSAITQKSQICNKSWR